jgi:hypothetical protein
MSFQHLSHAWLLPAVTIAFLTGCEPTHLSIDSPSSTAAIPPMPVRGIQYYSRQNAKYLGTDSTGSTGYRLIDDSIFAHIRQGSNGAIDGLASRELYDSSLPITVDNGLIQSDCQLSPIYFPGPEYRRDLVYQGTAGYQYPVPRRGDPFPPLWRHLSKDWQYPAG